MVDVSLTAVNTFLECEKRYDYGYRQRLEPLNKRPEPIMGSVLHEYLERYYGNLKEAERSEAITGQVGIGTIADRASDAAWQATVNAWEPEILAWRQSAWLLGDEDAARKWENTLPEAERMIAGYHKHRGRADARRWEILYVEQDLAAEVLNGVVTRGKVDLVVRKRHTGRVALVEHKSTGTVPDDGVRLRDLQTPMYARILELQEGIRVDEVIWNYIRTKAPARPKVNKDGSLSRQAIDTTRREYLAAIRERGLDRRAYAEMLAKLKHKAKDEFYPRFTRVIVADVDELIANFRRGAAQLNNRVEEWEAWGSEPIRNLSRGCQFCEFAPLCNAALTGGDEEDVIRMKYRYKGRRNG